MLNLTVDHRVADGAIGAAFLSKMVELIENPQGFSWQPTSLSWRWRRPEIECLASPRQLPSVK